MAVLKEHGLSLLTAVRANRFVRDGMSVDHIKVHDDLWPVDLDIEVEELARLLIAEPSADKKFVHQLAAAYLRGSPLDPMNLRGQESTLAIWFYGYLRDKPADINEHPSDAFNDFMSGPFMEAVEHARRIGLAKNVLSASAPRNGDGRVNHIGRLTEDFLIAVVLHAKRSGMDLRIPSSNDAAEAETPVVTLAYKLMARCQEKIFRAADLEDIPREQAEKISGELGDLIGRPIVDRLRRTIKEFG